MCSSVCVCKICCSLSLLRRVGGKSLRVQSNLVSLVGRVGVVCQGVEKLYEGCPFIEPNLCGLQLDLGSVFLQVLLVLVCHVLCVSAE